MKQRFEFQEGKSSKFWEIELHGSSITTTWGRIGTAGQSKTKDFDSDAKAEKEYNKLIAEKAGKGYTEVNVFSEDADNLEQAGRESSPEVDSNKDDSFPVLLNCIREWLQKTEPQYHNCPELKTSSEDYAELVRQVDAKLPEQFFQLYNVFGGLALSYGFCDCNDGQKNDEEREPDDLFGGAYFMPLAGVDGVVFEHERFEDQDFEDEPAQGPVKRMCYNKQWIPFAKDYGGNFVGIDLDPAKHGKYGQVIKFGRDEVPTVLAQDLQTFFGNYCKNHGISLPDAISQALLQAKTNVAQNTERKKTKDSGFSSVKGVAKKVLREPDLLESGISFLQKKLESNKGTTRISAMEEIGSIAEETRYLLNSFPKQREDTIRKMLLDCAHSIQPFLFSESKEETEGSLRTLTAIEHCPALPDMIKCLDEQDVCLEAIWCLGKFETKAAAAASKLMLIINNQQSRMGSYPYDFSVVEAALLSLESIGYVPTAEDNVFGILVRDKDASIAAVTCRLLARNSQLAKTYVDSIKIYLADKRGRLSDSARDALAAARK